ncbi:pirin family protein [Variovorax robiniae]|uniref:Pirin family protein n=1 Tax=Variovorax robiniae TaxID=1836199 RepID=A0ABU8XBF2_9BURK
MTTNAPTTPHVTRLTELQPVATPRGIDHIVAGVSTSDGDGVKLTRVLQQPLQQRLDPYLMLDAFGSDNPGDYIGGFPNHPHRGFETVTYMIAGRMRHRDSAGHEGLLSNGGVQWMTAGRGLVHSELPEQEDGVMEGFQLWLNLPSKNKMCDPWYRDIQSAMQREHTEPLYLDITLPPGAEFWQPLPDDRNALVYAFRESVWIGNSEVPTRRMAIMANDPGSDGIRLRAAATNHSPARALLIAGKPLHEPIAQYGPFVMNTREQLMEAVHDFQNGRLG